MENNLMQDAFEKWDHEFSSLSMSERDGRQAAFEAGAASIHGPGTQNEIKHLAKQIEELQAELVSELAAKANMIEKIAVRIMLEAKGGAALNVVVEDYPDVWEMIQRERAAGADGRRHEACADRL